MISGIHLVLFDLGNTLFYDNAAAWPKVYARAEAALWQVLRRSGVKVPSETVYGKSDTLLGYYYALRGTGIKEPGTFQVLRDLLISHAADDLRRRHHAGIASHVHRSLRPTGRWSGTRLPTLRAIQRRGLRIGAISNGSYDWNALELLNRAGLRRYFEMVLTSDAHGRAQA